MHQHFPGKLLAYNCSPSFNWRDKLDAQDDRGFPEEPRRHGLRYQFVTLAGFHSLNPAMFELAQRLCASAAWPPMPRCRSASSPPKPRAIRAIRHQREVGTGYFDAVAMAVSGGTSSTTAMSGSTEAAQFLAAVKPLAVAAE